MQKLTTQTSVSESNVRIPHSGYGYLCRDTGEYDTHTYVEILVSRLSVMSPGFILLQACKKL